MAWKWRQAPLSRPVVEPMWGQGFPLYQDFPKPDMSESGDKNGQGMQRCEVQRSGKGQKESDAHAFRLPSHIAPVRNLSLPACEMGNVFTINSGGCPWQRWSRENRILAFRDGAGGEQREGLLQAKVVLEESTISRTPEPLEHLFRPAWRWGYEFRLNLSHPRYKLSTCPQRTLKVFHIWYLTKRGVRKKRRFG